MTADKKKRKEKLTIYLARTKNPPEAEIINVGNSQQPIDIEIAGAEHARLFIKKPSYKTPGWTNLFVSDGQLTADQFGQSSNVGAALLIKSHSETFVLSFGMGFHLVNQDSVERDFGLKVTINSVDPDKLRSLDKSTYDHNPLNSRTQSTKEVDIFDLHIDSDREMIYAITGASNIKDFGEVVTGRDALTIATETSLQETPKILRKTLERYNANLPSQFRWIDNINKVRDPEEIGILELELDEILASGNLENLWLGEPEIVNWEFQLGYSFGMGRNRPRHQTLSLDAYIEHTAPDEPCVSNMKKQKVHINDNEYNSTKCWTVYRCLYAEVNYNDFNYILRNGVWYRVNQDFSAAVDEALLQLDQYSEPLPEYNHRNEGEYNTEVATESGFDLMDKNNIKIGGPYDKLEHCDLIKDGKQFIHVKVYRSSSTLSHLFAQGLVAAEAFVSDEWYRKELNPKLPESIKLPNPENRPEPKKYKVVYAIATNKKIPEELPFFSKVTLKNSLKTLKALNYNVEIARIPLSQDIIVKKTHKPGKPKNQ